MSFSVYGYGRASDDKQVLSTDQQESVVREAFELFRKIKPGWDVAQWGGFFRDEATCRVTKFREREYGSIALAALQPNDVLLVSNYDRIFANVIDVAETLQIFDTTKRRLLILDMDIDTSTDLGNGLMKIMAVIKELEWKEIRRRARGSTAHRKKRGLPYGTSLCGWKNVRVLIGNKPHSFYEPDYPMRRYYNELMRLHDRGLSYEKVVLYCQRQNICNPNTGKPPTSTKTVHDAIKAALRNFALPNGTHPEPIPPGAKPYKVDTIKLGA